ncbi:cell envelope integrity protein CreD [Shewanella sp. A3A]|nr:cell envelope integrity protein CreD [Shewanella ferrihydritica]
MLNVASSLTLLVTLAVVAGCIYLIYHCTNKDRSPLQGAALYRAQLTVRLCILVGLGLVSLLPLGLIQSVSDERAALHQQVVKEIGHSWGSQQTLGGPALVIPYQYEKFTETNVDGKVERQRQVFDDELVILPHNLTLDADLQHQFRTRGIYQSLVYQGEISGEAEFTIDKPDMDNLVKWDIDHARIVFGVSDNQAIEQVSRFNLAGEQHLPTLDSGTQLPNIYGMNTGFQRRIALAPNQYQFTLSFALTLRGSEGLNILPLGDASHIHIKADWPHPSFKGYLPASRTITDSSFDATWNISHLTRNYPQVFSANVALGVTEVIANVTLFEPVTHYGKIERSLKYGILFILLTYIMLLIFELGQKSRLSTVQYLLVGCAMCLFYMLLLSLSEHMAFLSAYLAAAAVPLISIPLYVGSASRSKRQGGVMLLMLVALYAVLYSILQLEDYALLMGTGLLVVILLILMYLTRHQSEPT